jgi:hypothetical protein
MKMVWFAARLALPAHFLIAYFEEMSAESHQELTRHYVNSIVRRRRIKFEMLNHTMHFSHGWFHVANKWIIYSELNLMCSRSQQDNVSSLNAQVIRLPAGIESSVSLSLSLKRPMQI